MLNVSTPHVNLLTLLFFKKMRKNDFFSVKLLFLFHAVHTAEKEAKTFLFFSDWVRVSKQNYAKSQMQLCLRRKFNSQGLRKRDKNIFVKARIHFSARACTYIIALVLLKVFLSAFSNISSFGLEGCDILVLPRKNFLVGKVFFHLSSKLYFDKVYVSFAVTV